MKKRSTVKAVVSAVGGLALVAGAVLFGCDGNTPSIPPDDGPLDEKYYDGRKVLIDPDGFDARSPLWSPSCDKVVFQKYELPLYGDKWLCIYDIDEGTFTDIDNAAPSPRLYDWSPDGEWIAYQSHNNWGLYIIRPDGSENVFVYNPGIGSTSGSFSPDGEKIVFACTEGTMVADISDPYNIEFDLLPPFQDEDDFWYWDGFPHWSPDGRYIARMRVYEDEFDFVILTRVYVIDPEAGDEGKWELLFEESADEWVGLDPVGWSPDGRYLSLMGSHNSDTEIWAYELDTEMYYRITCSNLYSHPSYGDWGANGEVVFKEFDYAKYKNNPDGPWHVIYTIDGPP